MKNEHIRRETSNHYEGQRDENDRPVLVISQDDSILPRLAQLTGNKRLVDLALNGSSSLNNFDYLVAGGRTFVGKRQYDGKSIQLGIVGYHEDTMPQIGNINQLQGLIRRITQNYKLSADDILTKHEFTQRKLNEAESKRGMIFDLNDRDVHKNSSYALDQVISELRNGIYVDGLRKLQAGEILDRQIKQMDRIKEFVA